MTQFMKDLQIRMADERDFAKIVSFNKKMYPKRDKIEEKLEFWTSQKYSYKGKIILVDEDQNVYGQVMTTEMDYYYEGSSVNTIWLFDWIVDVSLRASAWGAGLILYCKSKYPKSFSTGANTNALSLHLKLGNQIIGHLKKYIKINNPFFLITSLFRGEIPAEKFPSSIKLQKKEFKRIEKRYLPDLVNPYNDSLLEIGRTKQFLSWRFYNNLHSYAFYKDMTSDDYFVVRTIVKKHITLLVLVDYRFNWCKTEKIENIVRACNILANYLHLFGVICGSSLSTIDSVLESKGYRLIGSLRPIMGFIKCKDRKEDIENRNFCLVTLADSDGETNW